MTLHTRKEEVEKARREIKRETLTDPGTRELVRKHLDNAAPILNELISLGYDLETLDDLRHQGRAWKSAIPVLLRWLPKVADVDIKENIVRCLSVPWVGNRATAELIYEFKKYGAIDPVHSDDITHLSSKQFIKHLATLERRDPSSSLAWTIGNALSIVDVTGFERQVIELCRNRRYGAARQMLVLGLARLHDSGAEDAAIELLRRGC